MGHVHATTSSGNQAHQNELSGRCSAGDGTGRERSIWSVRVLPDGTLVSGDSLGNVQFWDAQHGTLLQGFARHRGPVLALAALPDGHTIFASGVDNQVGSQNLLRQLRWAAADSGPGTLFDRQTDVAHGMDNQVGALSRQ